MLTSKELFPGTRVYLTDSKIVLENESAILSKFPLYFNVKYTIREVRRYNEGIILVRLCESGESSGQWYSSSIFSTSPELQSYIEKSANKTISELFEEKVKAMQHDK